MFDRATLKGLSIGLALAACATTALGDDSALYAEALPDDAVFVRALSPDGPDALAVALGGRTLHLDPNEAGAYSAVSAAHLDGIRPGSFFSVVSTHDGTDLLISEPPRKARDKVHLILINAGADPVRLVVPDHAMEVVAPVKHGEAGSRPVNPVAAKLAVERVSDAVVLAEFDLRLSRGQNLTFFARDGDAQLIENSFGPELKLK